MNLADILQRHLAQKFKGQTVTVPKGANKVSDRIDSLNAAIDKCSCEVTTRNGSFNFEGASMDKTPNPFTKEKALLQSNASVNQNSFEASASTSYFFGDGKLARTVEFGIEVIV